MERVKITASKKILSSYSLAFNSNSPQYQPLSTMASLRDHSRPSTIELGRCWMEEGSMGSFAKDYGQNVHSLQRYWTMRLSNINRKQLHLSCFTAKNPPYFQVLEPLEKWVLLRIFMTPCTRNSLTWERPWCLWVTTCFTVHTFIGF